MLLIKDPTEGAPDRGQVPLATRYPHINTDHTVPKAPIQPRNGNGHTGSHSNGHTNHNYAKSVENGDKAHQPGRTPLSTLPISTPAVAPVPAAPLPTPLPATSLPPPPPPPTSLEFVDRLMTPPGGFETRRRGRQATACLECNRRKQKCDRLQPCHHCAKRNLVDGCVYPEPASPSPMKRRGTSPSLGPGKRRRESDASVMGGRYMDSETANTMNTASVQSPTTHTRSISSASTGSGFSEHTDSLPALTPETFAPHPLPLPTSLPPTARPINRSIPVSSERHEVVTPPPQWEWREGPQGGARGGGVGLGTPMRIPEDGHERHVPPPNRGHNGATVNGNISNGAEPRRGSLPRIEDHLMQEGGAAGVGSLTKEGNGAEQHGHQFQFYGTSHFGPRLAAQVMHGGKPNVDVSDSQYCSSSGDAELLAQIRALDGALPKRSLCGRFVAAFFEKYNSWVDILYARDFYARHDEFWVTHSEFEDLTRIDLRWFALFHTILAFGSLLDDRANLGLAERQAISNKCFVAARRALSEAPSFYGESLDTVTAYTLLSLYLVAMRRMPESWHMVGSGVRAAQAQGFQVDGETWHLHPRDAELWRRLWAQMYILDRSISYFLGRPLAIQDGSFTTHPPANMHDEELEILPRRDWPLTTTTHSTFLILHYKLAQIIGQILTSCFGLNPRNHAEVMRCEDLMVKWSQSLPPAFRLDEPDTSGDDAQPWIRLQRRTLMSKFHQARISLHRPYLLPSGRADYAESRLCCVLSAGVELRHRLSLLATDHDPFDRFKWLTVASGFSPACVLGLLLARAKREVEFNYDAIRSLLIEYITVEKNTLRRDRTLENELAVLDMMLAQAHEVDAQAQRSLRTSKAPTRAPTPTKKREQKEAVPRTKPESPMKNGHISLPPPTYPPSTPATLSPTTPVSSSLQNPSAERPSQVQSAQGPGSEAPPPQPQPRQPPQQYNPPNAFPGVLPTVPPQQPRIFDRPLYYPLTPPPLSFVAPQASSAYNPTAHGHPSPTNSLINPTGALATLAPAPPYEDPRLFTFPSPMDPSADTFPPVHDTEAWVGLLESIGPDWGSVSITEEA